MSVTSVQRKPPAQSADMEYSIISNYLEKSPITSKFRHDNPNLQPATSDSDEDPNYSSLDPTVVTPPSPPMSQISKGRYAMTAPAPLPEPAPEQDQTSRNKLKRLSLTSLRSTSSFGSHKRFSSISSSLSKLTLSSSSSMTSLSSVITEDVGSSQHWKYHILKFGKDLYLTTNPSMKHMYCRNGPGYYVEINNGANKATKSTDGFTMVFKDVENVEAGVNRNDQSLPIMVIEKHPKKQGGYFTVTLIRRGHFIRDVIKYDPQNQDAVKPFNALSIPHSIPEEYIPYDKISNAKRLESSEMSFKNYAFKDFNNSRWNIGSIPRVRYSKINRFKHKLNDHDEQLKFIGKNNIYFHQNYVDEHSIPNSLPYKKPHSNPEDIYLQREEAKFPPVLAMFRPLEQKFTSRIVNNINRRMSRIGTDRHSSGTSSPPGLSRSSTNTSVRPSTRINGKDLDHDFSTGQIKHYYTAGDGLYQSRHPQDDSPEANKLGWLTIFEDKAIFDSKGMFDLVLGLTLAIGYESTLGK